MAFALRAWASVVGPRNLWPSIAAAVLGLAGLGGAIAARAFMPGWAGEVTLVGAADIHAFFGVVALALIAGALTAEAPDHERVGAARDLVLALAAATMAVVLGSRLNEIRSVIEAFMVVDAVSPEHRMEVIARGAELAWREAPASSAALAALALASLPAFAGLAGIIGKSLTGRVAAGVVAAVLLVLPMPYQLMVHDRTKALLVRYGEVLLAGAYLGISEGDIDLPEHPAHGGAGPYFLSKVVLLDAEGVRVDGRRLATLAQLDSEEGLRKLGADVAEIAEWTPLDEGEGAPQPEERPDRERPMKIVEGVEDGGHTRVITLTPRDRRINVGAEGEVPALRLLEVMEALGRGGAVQVALLYELHRSERLVAPFDAIPNGINAVRINAGFHVVDSMGMARIIALDQGFAIEVDGQPSRTIGSLEGLEPALNDLFGASDGLASVTLLPAEQTTVGQALEVFHTASRVYLRALGEDVPLYLSRPD
jgi:hypothetical protein